MEKTQVVRGTKCGIYNVSIYFPSLFIQTIVTIHRSKSRKHCLFFLVFISRILAYLELKDFPASNFVHLTTLVESFFLTRRQAQKKMVEPSVGSSKRPWVESSARDMPAEEIAFDPITADAEDAVDEVDIEIGDAEPTVPSPLSLSLSLCYDGDVYDNSSSIWTTFG